jgi:hypothetical protein
MRTSFTLPGYCAGTDKVAKPAIRRRMYVLNFEILILLY